MTTKVTVDAHAGLPVVVEFINPTTGETQYEETVEPNTVQDFYIHANCDIYVREVQSSESSDK